MTGRPGPNTRRLLVEEGGFLYDRDSLADELPYWLNVSGRPHLVIPYSYEANDNRFNENSGFSTAGDFFTYMHDAFDVLYREGQRGSPKLLSIGLHDRLIGRPGRCRGLLRLLEYMRGVEGVWFATGADIAQHWRTHFPASRLINRHCEPTDPREVARSDDRLREAIQSRKRRFWIASSPFGLLAMTSHCTEICACAMTLPHNASSSSKNFLVSSGVVAPGSS